MKKLVITALLLLSTGLVQAMESNKKEKNVIEGSIAIKPQRPCYAGKCTLDLSEKIDIRKLLNDQSIQADDLLQEVYAWHKDNNSSIDLTNNCIYPYPSSKYFPTYLPYNYLKNLKEGDILDVTVNGNCFKLKADQYGTCYYSSFNGGCGNFEKTLAYYKSLSDKKASYFTINNNEEFLLERGILRKTWSGKIVNGNIFSRLLWGFKEVLREGL